MNHATVIERLQQIVGARSVFHEAGDLLVYE